MHERNEKKGKEGMQKRVLGHGWMQEGDERYEEREREGRQMNK